MFTSAFSVTRRLKKWAFFHETSALVVSEKTLHNLVIVTAGVSSILSLMKSLMNAAVADNLAIAQVCATSRRRRETPSSAPRTAPGSSMSAGSADVKELGVAPGDLSSLLTSNAFSCTNRETSFSGGTVYHRAPLNLRSVLGAEVGTLNLDYDWPIDADRALDPNLLVMETTLNMRPRTVLWRQEKGHGGHNNHFSITVSFTSPSVFISHGLLLFGIVVFFGSTS